MTVQRRRGLPGGGAPGDEMAMSRLLGGGVVRWLVAVPSWPRFGPFGAHLGLGGPSLLLMPPMAAGGVTAARVVYTAARLLQRGDRSFTSPRARPGQVGLVCSCCCIRSVTAIGDGGCALPRVHVQLLLAPGCLFSSPSVSLLWF
jgi:hypothetical protein